MFSGYAFDVVITFKMHSTWQVITTWTGERQDYAQVRKERVMEAFSKAYQFLICEKTDMRLLMFGHWCNKT